MQSRAVAVEKCAVMLAVRSFLRENRAVCILGSPDSNDYTPGKKRNGRDKRTQALSLACKMK